MFPIGFKTCSMLSLNMYLKCFLSMIRRLKLASLHICMPRS